MKNNFYKKHDIMKGWNHPLASKVRQLDLDRCTQETLQAICMWRQVFLYKGKTSGLPQSLEPQLGFRPSLIDVTHSIQLLRNLKYVTLIDIEKEGTKRILKFDINKHVIDEALQPPMQDLLNENNLF